VRRRRRRAAVSDAAAARPGRGQCPEHAVVRPAVGGNPAAKRRQEPSGQPKDHRGQGPHGSAAGARTPGSADGHPCPAFGRCQGAPRSPDARATQTAGTDAVGTSYIQPAGSDVSTPTPSNACQTSSIEDPRGVTAQSRAPRPVKPCRRMQSRIPNRSLHIVASDVLMKCPSAKTWAEAMVASRPPVWTISRAPAGLLRVTQPNPSGHNARIRTSARVSKTTGCPAIQLLSGASWRLARTSKPMLIASPASTTTQNHPSPDMRLNVPLCPATTRQGRP
jgi:hypothetical protein